jgi:hypothetical protein
VSLPVAIVENHFFSEGSNKGQRTIVLPNGKEHVVKPNQMIVWLSITSKLPHGAFPAAETPVFPAIVDTGPNICLSMTEEQFDYCRHPNDTFAPLRNTTVNGEPARIVLGDAWIYRQTPEMPLGKYYTKQPRRLSLREGVRVRSPASAAKSGGMMQWIMGTRTRQPAIAWSQPLPLLGLEVFPVNRLGLDMDGYLRRFAISHHPNGK